MRPVLLVTVMFFGMLLTACTKTVYVDRYHVIAPEPAMYLLPQPPQPLDFDLIDRLMYENDIVALQSYLGGAWLSAVRDEHSCRAVVENLEDYSRQSLERFKEDREVNDESK